jgi:hypothetical protein
MCFGILGDKAYEWPGDPKKLIAEMEKEMAEEEDQLTEIQALEIMVETLERLDEAAHQRVLDYLLDRFCPWVEKEEEEEDVE